jgi:hypothetical protein
MAAAAFCDASADSDLARHRRSPRSPALTDAPLAAVTPQELSSLISAHAQAGGPGGAAAAASGSVGGTPSPPLLSDVASPSQGHSQVWRE